jgi:hypothetical protein
MKKNHPSISLHPKLATGLDVLMSLVLLILFKQVHSWFFLYAWFFLRIVWWGVLIRLVYYSPGLQRSRHLVALTIFNGGILCFFLFIDWIWSWYGTAVLFVVGPAISFWLLPVVNTNLSFISKPQKRLRFVLTSIGLAGMWSAICAIASLNVYPFLMWWIWIVVGAVVTGIVSGLWWREYETSPAHNFWIWVGAQVLLIGEVAGVVIMWPSAFLINGLFITWLWYLFWLLGRFHLSQEGIFWKKQIPFLIINAVILGLLLLFVFRWR